MTENDSYDYSQDSRAFIVRTWRSGPNAHWYFSVQDVASGKRHGFADLDAFLSYFNTTVCDALGLDGPATGPSTIGEQDESRAGSDE